MSCVRIDVVRTTPTQMVGFFEKNTKDGNFRIKNNSYTPIMMAMNEYDFLKFESESIYNFLLKIK